jgi:hypothetical protein
MCSSCHQPAALPHATNPLDFRIELSLSNPRFSPVLPDSRLLAIMSEAEWASLARNVNVVLDRRGSWWRCVLAVLTCGICLCPLLMTVNRQLKEVNAAIDARMQPKLRAGERAQRGVKVKDVHPNKQTSGASLRYYSSTGGSHGQPYEPAGIFVSMHGGMP